MVTTIVPAVLAGKTWRWFVAAVVFVMGGILGGGTFGFIVALFAARIEHLLAFSSSVQSEIVWLILSILAAGYALNDLGHIRLPVIPIRRQVPREWRVRYPLTLVAFVYGLDLGTGFTTQVTSSAIYILYLAAAGIGQPIVGAILLGCYGGIRTLVMMGLSYRLKTMEAAVQRIQDLAIWQPIIRVPAALSMIGISLVCGAQFIFSIV